MATYEYKAPSLRLIDTEGVLLKQGAEARVYAVPYLLPPPRVFWPGAGSSSSSGPSSSSPSGPSPSPSPPVILKHRFPKTYRHPTLDTSLTRTRLQFEARALSRCARAGVKAPTVLWVDEPAGVLAMERVEGWSVREMLGGGAEGEVEVDMSVEVEKEAGETGEEDTGPETKEETPPSEGMAALLAPGWEEEDLIDHVMARVGIAVARLHRAGIIHGDLTTSNMMVRMAPNADCGFEIVLIDFGLASQATMPETYAVDLYVLERAFASTHPASECMYSWVLSSYARELGEKKWKPIEAKLKEVRLRGRKRDMTG